MKKKHLKTMLGLFFLAMPMLVIANVSSGTKCISNCGYDSPVLTISIKAHNKKKNISNKKLKLFINGIDFRTKYPQNDKWFNDPFNETKKSSPSSLYEFNFTDNKSDINSASFQLLPFFSLKSQNNNSGQLQKQNMITLFQINFF